MGANPFEVYIRLYKANNIQSIPMFVKKGVIKECSLACTDKTKITLAIELLYAVKNQDELAGVIGHEMAHMIYKDELKADVLGLQYAKKAGYDYCKAAQYLKRMLKDSVHPAGIDRYKNTGCK